MPSDSPVKVICRFRPVDAREELEAKNDYANPQDAVCVSIKDDYMVRIPLSNSPHPIDFTLDDVLWTTDDQEETFHRVAELTIKDILKGYNGTIFAYGQTGSGKTHSMYGPEGKFSAAESGLVPRAISMLFQKLEDKDEIKEFSMKISFIEIYLEKMRDLLTNQVLTHSKNDNKLSQQPNLPRQKSKSSGKTRNRKRKTVKKDYNSLKIRTLPNGQTYIQGLHEEECESLMDVLGLISSASKERTTSATNMNRTSSRSHLVMIVLLEQKMIDGSIKVSKLNFADLAGSEKVKKTKASGIRLEEAKVINKSLSQLGLVIRALSEKKSFISYRDSTLTHLLKDSLGGNTKTTLLCTCSPHIFNRDETISTLRFATRAKLITNVVHKNTVLSPQQMAQLIKNLKTEIHDLKRQLQDKIINEVKEDDNEYLDEKIKMMVDPKLLTKRSSIMIDSNVQKQLITELENYKNENDKLKIEIEELKSREEELKRQIAELKVLLADEKDRYEQVLLKSDELQSQLNTLELENNQKDKLIDELKLKINELNAKLLDTAVSAEKKDEMQSEFLSVIYDGKLKNVEEDSKDVEHQFELVKQRLDQNIQDSKDLQFRYESGDITEIENLKQSESFEFEKKFLEEQETRLNQILNLFKQEKQLLIEQQDTSKTKKLAEQLELLTKYLNLKDKQISDFRKDLSSLSEQIQNKDNKLVSQNNETRMLREKVKLLENENKGLNSKVRAYFSFGKSPQPSGNETMTPTPILPNSPTTMTQSKSVWEQVPSRGRGATYSVPRSGSQRKHDVLAELMIDQEKYLQDLAMLRSEREKQKKLEQKKTKELEAAAKAAEEEARRKQAELDKQKDLISIKPSEIAIVTTLNAQESHEEQEQESEQPAPIQLTTNKSNLKKISPRDRTESKDFGTINPYGKKKKRRGSKTKFGKGKVAAMIAGFEQIEKKDEVFESDDEEDDDAVMMLNMLSPMPTDINVEDWSIDDVCSWLKTIDEDQYIDIFRENRIDGSILWNDIENENTLIKMGIDEIHSKKLFREITLLKNEININYDYIMDDDEKLNALIGYTEEIIDPFEMIKNLFDEMDKLQQGCITFIQFKESISIVDIKLTDIQIEHVYNSFHFSDTDGITEEEMILTLGKIFTEHACNNAKTAFRLACVYFLQSSGLMENYASHLEDLFENSDEVKKNLDLWKILSQSNDIDKKINVKPFMDEKLMKLMKTAGKKVVIIDKKRIPTIEEFDDMQCARMAGDACHLSVLKIWWIQSKIHGMQATYTSSDGKHFTTIRHVTPIVSDDNDDMHETIITLKHDEFIKYTSISVTNFIHNITIVTTLGKRYECGQNRSNQLIQFKPPSSCGILAFYGTLTKIGMSSIGCYTVRNEKVKLRSMTAAGIEQAHLRAKLRTILKNKIKKNISLEDSIGHVMDNYSELQVRTLIEDNDKKFLKDVILDLNTNLKAKSSVRRKISFLGFGMK